MYAQGYFVYDSKKAGSVTVSHLRFSPRPIDSTYLIDRASFVACHQFNFIEKMDVLDIADPGATFLLNSPLWAGRSLGQAAGRDAAADHRQDSSSSTSSTVSRWLREAGMGGRINTVMQTCFFALSGILPREEAIEQIKKAINKTYGKRGESILKKNFAAVDGALGEMAEVQVPAAATSTFERLPMRGRRWHRLRQTRHVDSVGWQRRLAAGQCLAARRYVPHRHGQDRETQYRPGDSHLGSDDLHRLCHVFVGLPPCGHSHEALPARGIGRRPGYLPIEGSERQGFCRPYA